MKKLISVLTVSLLMSLSAGAEEAPPTPVQAQTPKTFPVSLAPMLEKATPAVVKITTAKESVPVPFEQKKQPGPKMGMGSGVIIDAEKGLIVTNAHVISQAKVIIVTLKNGRRYIAKLLGEDDGFDIGVIQIHANDLVALPLGDSDQLRVGDFVAAIGSPFGLSETVTSGVISALDRSEPKIEGYQSFIQTDTPINPGNSGGALVNMQGQLIGINTALVSPAYGNVGIGFAIPSNMVTSVVQQLLKYGKVERGMLGVIAQDISASLADALDLKASHGAIVTTIIPNSPAQKAGLKIEDVIISLNGKTIRSAEQLRDTLAIMPPETALDLVVSRAGKMMTLHAIVGDPQKLAKQRELPFIGGLQLQDFNELEPDATYLKGVLVTGVREISPAALAGLIPGDVIIRANEKPVASTHDLEAIVKTQPRQLLLQVSRDNTGIFLVIEKENG